MTIRHAGKERLVQFVSGHLDLTPGEFDEHYKDKINRAVAMGHCFVVGDAPGCDSMAQELLRRLLISDEERSRYDYHGYSRITVFHMLESPRNLSSLYFARRDGFLTDEERDAAMTEASDVDIAWVRPSGSKRHSSGTQKNLDRRKAKNLRLFLKERATWDKVDVREDMGDDGIDRFSIVNDSDREWYPPTHRNVPIPPGLRDQLRHAERELRAAESAYFTAQMELRRAIGDKESYND